MTLIRLPYGSKHLEAEIPDNNLLGQVMPNKCRETTDEAQLIRQALARPIGSVKLKELAMGRDSTVIIVSDVTRMAPSNRFLPHLLAELAEGGIGPEKVTIIIGLGNHRPVSEAEKRALIGDNLYGRVRCIHSKEADFQRVGYTSRGTPVDVCRPVLEADLRICTGNIEYHRLSGFSGGAKAMLPGVASSSATAWNHAMAERPGVGPGQPDANPVREDMEEFARIARADFAFNVVTDERGQITGAYAGDLVAAHRKGCEQVKKLYRIIVEKAAEVVIVSPGGQPKDTSVYQAQKALVNALEICRPGGTVIVAAECGEGFGDEVFARWMMGVSRPEELRKLTRQGFVLGGHKAKTVLEAIEKVSVYWISEMPEQQVNRLFYQPAPSLQAAVDKVLARYNPDAGVWVMPYGGICFPVLRAHDCEPVGMMGSTLLE